MTVKLAPTELNKVIIGEELAAMGDIGPCELIKGKIVPMSPTGYEHGNIEGSIVAKLYAFVSTRNLGKVQSGQVGVYTRRNPDTVRGADVLFISNERYAKRKSPSYLDVAPDLVVEILSPDDRWSEVTETLREYFSIGIRLVWIVDPKPRRVYAYRTLTDVQEFTEHDDLSGNDVLAGFSVKVGELFED